MPFVPSRGEALLKRLEYIRERPIALRNAAASRRSEPLARATAVVACYRPHRNSGDVAVCVGEVQQRLRIAQLKDLSVDVVHSDHGSYSDTGAQAGRHNLIMGVGRRLLSAESHLTSIVVGRTVVHSHDIYDVQAESISFHTVQNVHTARHQSRGQDRQGVGNYETGIRALERLQRLVATRDRGLVSSRSTFDIEVQSHRCTRVRAVFVEHRLVSRLQTRNGRASLCEFSAGRTAERDDHIAACSAYALHQRDYRCAIRQSVIRDRGSHTAPGGRASAVADDEPKGEDLDTGLLLNRCELPISSKAHVYIRREHFRGWRWRSRTAQRGYVYRCALRGAPGSVCGRNPEGVSGQRRQATYCQVGTACRAGRNTVLENSVAGQNAVDGNGGSGPTQVRAVACSSRGL